MREDLLKQYAEFAVKVGVNPQKGQTMLISCSVESAPFARLCAKAAFEAGARDVVMKYTDEQIARIRMENASVETLEDVKPYILCRERGRRLHSEHPRFRPGGVQGAGRTEDCTRQQGAPRGAGRLARLHHEG